MSKKKNIKKEKYDEDLIKKYDYDNDYDEDSFDDDFDDIDENDLTDEYDEKIIIEDEYSFEITDEDTCRFDSLYHFNTNKHKQEGKHRLKEDTIFKGKVDKKNEDYEDLDIIENDDYNNIINFFDYESVESSNYNDQNNLIKDIYDILKNKTDIDFTQNRRKPNKETFNSYYNLLLNDLDFKYTKSEIFVELSFYFTDNIFNMYKLLDKDSATSIIKELIQKGFLKNLENINFL